jgi:hypothetical protein
MIGKDTGMRFPEKSHMWTKALCTAINAPTKSKFKEEHASDGPVT